MTTVVIQPSTGNAASRRRWSDTIEQGVRFLGESRERHLTEAQVRALRALHPSGHARFWGGRPTQTSNLARTRPGDVVLFTGQKRVHAVGEMGYLFTNVAFADTLWEPDPAKGGWDNVYSLAAFTPTDIPYTEIWDLPGFNAGDNFMGLRILTGEKATTILEGLAITTTADRLRDRAEETRTATALTQGTAVVPMERIHTTATSYRSPVEEIVVSRTEALLVRAYVDSLDGVETRRLRTPAGLTDIHLRGPDGTEIIEAKRGADHRFVREALGQLLDYAPHSPAPADRLSALLPARPASADVALLHRYGIDCIFRTPTGGFSRLPAPAASRDRMRAVWTR